MLTAPEIIERVRATYRDCASYADTGDVTTVSTPTDGSRRGRTSVKPFSTSLVRPDRFRYEFREEREGPEPEWPLYVIWSSAGHIQSWWTITPEIRSHESVLAAIAGPTGVSGSSAYRIPALLFPGGTGRDPLGGHRRVERVEECDGVRCWALSADPETGEALWVSEDSFLIHRVHQVFVLDAASLESADDSTERWLASPGVPEEQKRRVREAMENMRKRKQSDVHVETTTVYRPQINIEIEDERFTFEPPFIGKPRWA